jgi:AraC family transcriptional activator of pobA
MRRIPNYSLYGESARPPWYDAFNFEWIPERSRPNDWHIDAHRHDALLQFLYICSGSGQVVIENTKTQIEPPCIVLLPAQTVHGFVFSPDVDGLVITAAQRSLESISSVVSPGLIPVLQRAAVIPLTAQAVEDNALMPLFARLSERASAPAVASTERRALQIRQFRNLVAAHFREHQPVEFYAQKLGMTVAQLGRICREELSSSPLAIVNEHLVREAQRDLVYSGMSIKQIAHGLGFSDIAYFSRYFRKQTGVTPTEFQGEAHKALAIE